MNGSDSIRIVELTDALVAVLRGLADSETLDPRRALELEARVRKLENDIAAAIRSVNG